MDPGRIDSLKRGAYILMLLLVFATSSVGVVIGALAGQPSAASVTLAFFFSASFCALSIWAVVVRATPLWLVEEAIWVVIGVLSVAVFFHGLYLAELPSQSRLDVAVPSLWMPVAYATVFIARDGWGAFWRSAALFLAVLVVYLPRVAGLEGGTPLPSLDRVQLVLPHLSGAVIIAALLFFGALKDRALEWATAVDRMRVLADTDVLTGLPNRRYVEEFLVGEFGRSRRYGVPLSFIIFDLDDFKSVNDLHGHGVGDSVLVGVSRAIEPWLRENDVLGRWGGEEFVVVAPHTNLTGALRLAARIRDGFKGRRPGSDVEVTASFGVATAHPRDDDASSLVNRADDALYRAKRAGKDRVWGETDP